MCARALLPLPYPCVMLSLSLELAPATTPTHTSIQLQPSPSQPSRQQTSHSREEGTLSRMIVFGVHHLHSPPRRQVQREPNFWVSFWAFLEDQKAPRLTEVPEN